MQLYVDMDGVLADFDRGYEEAFGVKTTKEADNVDWKLVRNRLNFYRDLPPMPDMLELWWYVEHMSPIVLTGIPSSVSEAAENKKAWIRKNLGDHVRVECCPSKEKFTFAKPGDILIDDWTKYQSLWVAAGGVWITHTSAANTVLELKKLEL